jgi:hypothetical protein
LFDNPLAGASTLFYKQSLDFQAVIDAFRHQEEGKQMPI